MAFYIVATIFITLNCIIGYMCYLVYHTWGTRGMVNFCGAYVIMVLVLALLIFRNKED
jgi:hypothetical protein